MLDAINVVGGIFGTIEVKGMDRRCKCGSLMMRMQTNRLGWRRWVCPKCGTEIQERI